MNFQANAHIQRREQTHKSVMSRSASGPNAKSRCSVLLYVYASFFVVASVVRAYVMKHSHKIEQDAEVSYEKYAERARLEAEREMEIMELQAQHRISELRRRVADALEKRDDLESSAHAHRGWRKLRLALCVLRALDSVVCFVKTLVVKSKR